MLQMRLLRRAAAGRDDTAALQSALDRAEGSGLRLEARTYQISDTLLVPSATMLDGSGAVLKTSRDDRPVLASKAYFNRGPVRGRTRVERLRLEGTRRGAGQHGFVLHDFWSEIADVEVVDVGGRGLVVADVDIRGRAPTGTLVENRIRGFVVRGCRGGGMRIGEVANGRLTDGAIRNCIIDQAPSAREPALMIGHAAGWTIDGLHTYGGRPDRAIEIHQAYFTSLSNLYVESFGKAAVALLGTQTSATLTNLHLFAKGVDADAVFLDLSAHRDYPNPRVLLSNMALWREDAGAMEAIRIADSGLTIEGGPIAVLGPGARDVRTAALPVSGAPAAGRGGPRTLPFTGRSPQSLEIAAERGQEAFQASVLVAVIGRAPDGAVVTRFVGLASWGRTRAGDPLPHADIVPLLAPAGFIAPPTLEIGFGPDGVVLRLAFTAAASGSGHLTVG